MIPSVIATTIALFLISFLPAYPSFEDSIKSYDIILARLESQSKTLEHVSSKSESTTEPSKLKRWTLSFENETLPDLNGVWTLNKTTVKRLIQPYLTRFITHVHANSRLPIEKRDFKDKEVVINARGPDFFVVHARHAVTNDEYFDPNMKETISYQNFGFKGVIDPKDLTYAYTLKLNNYLDHMNLSRQAWLNGRLQYEFISSDKITAKGYEAEYSPEFQGFVLDEVVLEFSRVNKPWILEQPAYAGVIQPEKEEIINERK